MSIVARSVRLGDRVVPVVLPNRRDARLHTAAVIISIHVIGITALGFRVSIPQIVVAIATAGLIDIVMTLRTTGKLVWPASGMLTGSGVALILRLVGMESHDYWSWAGWYWFALVAGVAISTKYVVRIRGEHIFNPSNVGLVLAFLVIGSSVVEPLDFWWAPLGFWMIAVYLIIIVGGVLITRRLQLLEMAAGFWVALASGLGVLAASGHCMIATWSPTPVCDGRFWTVLVTSPEILIFLFFMITDPKTIPQGRAARLVFAVTLGIFTTLMIAPHAFEYGAKVGLLASLVIWSPLRGLFDRLEQAGDSRRSGTGYLLGRIYGGSPRSVFVTGLASGAGLVIVAVGIVAAGLPAQVPAALASVPVQEVAVEIDPTTLPEVDVDGSVSELDIDMDDGFVDHIALTLAENLAIEGLAIRNGDGSLLGLADGGSRLDEMQARLDSAIATGDRWADEFTFEALSLAVHESEGQVSAGLVFEGRGDVDRVLYDTAGVEVSRDTESFDATFVLRQLADDRWLLVEVDGA